MIIGCDSYDLGNGREISSTHGFGCLLFEAKNLYNL